VIHKNVGQNAAFHKSSLMLWRNLNSQMALEISFIIRKAECETTKGKVTQKIWPCGFAALI